MSTSSSEIPVKKINIVCVILKKVKKKKLKKNGIFDLKLHFFGLTNVSRHWLT